MEMGTKIKKRLLILCFILLCLFHINHGCQMDGVTNWALFQETEILDVDSGVIFSRNTRDIQEIVSVQFHESLKHGPYVDVSLTDSVFEIRTNEAFKEYEEYETLNSLLVVTINFSCTGGSTQRLDIYIKVQDTNNNDPIFQLDDSHYEFKVTPPLPPGYQLLCLQDTITARDIDLTTQRIHFNVYDNPDFEFVESAVTSTTDKIFNGVIKTTNFIRNIPEPIEFVISATDEDLTNDPNRTTYIRVRIISDGEFNLPEELIFTNSYYIAKYTENDEIELEEPITLRQGYDEQVVFTLDVPDEYLQYITIQTEDNNVKLQIRTSLPVSSMSQRNILLVIKAERENTAGASVTVIIQLPEEVNLMFEKPSYEGSIVDNVLVLSKLVLSQGYEDHSVSIDIQSEFAAFFSHDIQNNNEIELKMNPLSSTVIEENNIINLQVIASTSRTSATAIVTLQIVKDDNVTPVFDQTVYMGAYNKDNGLQIDQIVLTQGYDDTVNVVLNGEYAEYFKMDLDGPTITLTELNIPEALFEETEIILTIQATKPRTVGANAVLIIQLPSETPIEFESKHYKGSIKDNLLEVPELTLSQGYENRNVLIEIQSDFSSFFSHTFDVNVIRLTMLPLQQNIINEHSFINLQIIATNERSSAFAIVTLEIIKNDIFTPVFDRVVYSGSYDLENGLSMSQIIITQGYDENVIVSLDGDYSNYFDFDQMESTINLTASGITESLFKENEILLTIHAAKPRTVGASSTIIIKLLPDTPIKFETMLYHGIIKDNVLEVSELILNQGYENDFVSVDIQSDYSSFFSYAVDENEIRLSMLPLDQDIIERYTFLNLQIVASNTRSSAMVVVSLQIIKDDTFTPVFDNAVYSGSYDLKNGLSMSQIFIAQGYDESVNISLNGDHSNYFDFDQIESTINLTASNIPESLFKENEILLTIHAAKPRTVGASSTIIIKLLPDTPIEFETILYHGIIKDNVLEASELIMNQGYENEIVSVDIQSDYSSFFSYAVDENKIRLYMLPLDQDIIERHTFLNLQIVGSNTRSSAKVVVSLEIIKDDTFTPVFDSAVYNGSYDLENGLTVSQIVITQGYDSTITLSLDGEYHDIFQLNPVGSTITLTTANIPEEIFKEKQIILIINANKPRTVGAKAVILIILPDVPNTQELGFERLNYLGQFKGNTISLESIVLSEGYTPDVIFRFHGDLATYFDISRQGATLTVVLKEPTSIPEDSLPSNNIIVLDLEASLVEVGSTYATIILEVISEDDPPLSVLVFAEPIYTGQYTLADGFSFPTPVSLSAGYDDTVTFTLDGDDSQWFDLDRSENSVKLKLIAPIPPAVTANNDHLLFFVTATRGNDVTAQVAIMIRLPDDVPSTQELGFERLNYLGQLQGNTVSLESIVLSEGYTPDVIFRLHGDLATYFDISRQGATLTVELKEPTSIPEDSLPSNNIIVLELEASLVEVGSTYATIILEVISEDDPPPSVLVFAEPIYTGQYTLADGFSFPTPVSLSAGYDDTVTFTLDGDDSQWFDLDRSENSVTLKLIAPIPPAVMANNDHLLFFVTATRGNDVTAQVAIMIRLPDDVPSTQELGFERLNYIGQLQGNTILLESIVLSEGYTPEVIFRLHGDLATYFDISRQGATVTVVLKEPTSIPEDFLPSNNIIVLELEASLVEVGSTYATIILEVISENDPPPSVLVFAEPIYTGQYTLADGFSFPTPVSLSAGYDDTVTFTLDGDDSQWFDLDRSENSVTLKLIAPIPPAVTANNDHLLFFVTATRGNDVTAQVAIMIRLPDDVPSTQELGFERLNYLGQLQGNTISLESIVLSEGYTPDVIFRLHGDLATYFDISRQGATVTVVLKEPTSIPEDSLPSNNIIVLELEASLVEVGSTYATIILEVISENDPPPSVLVFAEPIYTGQYTLADGFSFPTPVSLSAGYDDTVTFTLDGDDSQWFDLDRSENSVTLELIAPIPPAVTANNDHLLFFVTATRRIDVTAQVAIMISLPDDVPSTQELGFERLNYLGQLQGNTISLESIVLSEGYTPDVIFRLHGDLATYFDISRQGATVTVVLKEPTSIPEDSLPSNNIIVLELEASLVEVGSTYATIILEVISENDPPPSVLVFAEPIYTGQYTLADGFSFPTPVSLSAGYDDTVTFTLDGDDSQWFDLDRSENSVTLKLIAPIPPAVTANNDHLLFFVTATRGNDVTAQVAIMIRLPDDVPSTQELGFERLNYLGQLQGNTISLESIVLSEGYTPDVIFRLHGDLATYFDISRQGATVTVVLKEPTSIPEDSLPSNNIIVLELEASLVEVGSTYATIILEVISENDPPPSVLVFAEPIYTGQYTLADGFSFPTPVSLSAGYDDTVTFTLDGDDSQWFDLDRSENSVTLKLIALIPPAVTANNDHLLFFVTATRGNDVTAQVAIMIRLPDDVPSTQELGFERLNYLGQLQGNNISLESIVLSEGYTPDVIFRLHGDLVTYFDISRQGATVTVVLKEPTSIPEDSLPSNNIIVLELEASLVEVGSTYATIILEVISENDSPPSVLVFAEPIYTGQYTLADGFSFPTPVSLSAGYDDTVTFTLDGDDSQWFDLDRSENSVTLKLIAPIPPAVTANNDHLLFFVTATRGNDVTAQVAIMIRLPDDVPSTQELGFERLNYLGQLQGNTISLESIVLSEGYTPDVIFRLHGDLATYFDISRQGATVTVVLKEPTSIPEDSLPSNNIIVLELEASLVEVGSTYATIILEVISENDSPPSVLVFAEPIYTGQYTLADGFSFPTPVSLSAGYDDTVTFTLDGDDSQWFDLDRSENSVTLKLIAPIPPAVTANNDHLLFFVTATRGNDVTAQVAIMIRLPDDVPSTQELGFERLNYLGQLQGNNISLESIVLSEGYTSDIIFRLHGDLATYFDISRQGATVTVVLKEPTSIPEDSLPSNNIIVLELEASLVEVGSTYATIILEVISEDDPPPSVLVFAEPIYTGQYTLADGFSFSTPVSLSAGYDDTVTFILDGDDSQWFDLDRSENSVTLKLIAPIPPAVTANNDHLLFFVTATRGNDVTAQVAIMIRLPDGGNTDPSAEFSKVLYQGRLQGRLVHHDIITLDGFDGPQIHISGEYSALFRGTYNDGQVVVEYLGSATLPSDVQHVILELQADSACAILALDVVPPELPNLSFSTDSYALRVNIGQSGWVGRVAATTENSESIVYSLNLDNDHLQSRLSITSDGELLLSAPADIGVYTFQVVAKTLLSQAESSATVQLTVVSMAPIVVIDRDEEEPHSNLLALDPELHKGCRYSLANRWPENQQWLYVDNSGLHTLAIDRENPSIAFMALSQMQVELTLNCDSDSKRSKRSTETRLDWLGPYDYGKNTWILANTTEYNPTKTIVNLIVNDINDNYPIFDGKENEPIVVGYPEPDLQAILLPRSLVELHATDADVGENAALRYWSSETQLAVSAGTGFVHVKDGTDLSDGILLTVFATDRNGQGLDGNITLTVKLLNRTNIAVITIRDAFLEDETRILSNLSTVVGYEVKALKSMVISDVSDELNRKKRNVETTNGPSLQIYVYGLVNREPISVDKLSEDVNENMNNMPIDVVTILSIEDYLKELMICENYTGLLTATIVLSILIFIIIVAVIVWYILMRIQKNKYKKFSDSNSIVSENDTSNPMTNPGSLKKPMDNPARPRLNIEELKRSEKRLQDMLNAPIEPKAQELLVQAPSTSTKKSEIVIPISDPVMPIVIQDKLKDVEESDDDEFGESKKNRRKSVVTFNENVEKIIHVQDSPQVDKNEPEYEVYKL